MRSIPPEEIVKWATDKIDKDQLNITYTSYSLTSEVKTKYFSELGMEIISNIEKYGYSVALIKEFFSEPLENEKGEIESVPKLNTIGITSESEKMVLLSRNAFNRVKRRISYYSKKKSDPNWLRSWMKNHNGWRLNTEPISWSEILIHELTHVIIIEKKSVDYLKRKEYEEKFNDKIHSADTNLIGYLVSKMTNLDHARDFRRIYNSLCKQYGVKPESKYAIN